MNILSGSPPPLPAQSGNSGKYLTTNGSKPSWGTVAAGGAWTELASVNLSSSATTLSTGTFTAKRFLRIIFYTPTISGIGTVWWFNGDTGTNYSTMRSTNSGAGGTNSNEAYIRLNTGNVSNTGPLHITASIANIAADYKMGIAQTGSYNATDNILMGDQRFVWKNNADQITSITVQGNNLANADLQAGTYLEVLGRD